MPKDDLTPWIVKEALKAQTRSQIGKNYIPFEDDRFKPPSGYDGDDKEPARRSWVPAVSFWLFWILYIGGFVVLWYTANNEVRMYRDLSGWSVWGILPVSFVVFIVSQILDNV